MRPDTRGECETMIRIDSTIEVDTLQHNDNLDRTSGYQDLWQAMIPSKQAWCVKELELRFRRC